MPFKLRYEIKANTHKDILKYMDDKGLYFDASKILNLGGGFKIARTSEEKSTDMNELIPRVCECILCLNVSQRI